MNNSIPIQQAPQWNYLIARVERDQFPHALLLHGLKGLGKNEFAYHLAYYLLCTHPTKLNDACHVCRNCQLMQAKTHPDFMILRPQEESSQIKIEQIRELYDFIYQKSHISQYKIVLITPADVMNISAANALLKILEEPPPKVVMILVAHQSQVLPATIRCRCQKVYFAPQEYTTQTEEGMQISNQLMALISKKITPVQAAQSINAFEFSKSIDLLIVWVSDAITMNLNQKNTLNMVQLYKIYDKLLESKKYLNTLYNLNKILWLEGLLILIQNLSEY